MLLIELIRENKNFINQKLIEKYINLNDLYFLHFTDIEKLGINPKYSYSNTPIGIYGYPLKQTWNLYGSLSKYPYAFDKKFVIIFKVSKNSKIFNLLENAKKSDVGAFYEYFSEKNLRENFNVDDDKIEEIKNIIKKSKIKVNDDIYFYVYKIFKTIFKESKISSKLTEFFRKYLNYDIVIDQGIGRIHQHEPIQAVVLNPRVIEDYKIYNNPTNKELAQLQ
ncbi:MAG: hypothetical protein NZZ41_02945 [Candidatus Dojkabacteria bacterium]|nr:hypothetical protein [Candidatus Dojkabacteria bacterium]